MARLIEVPENLKCLADAFEGVLECVQQQLASYSRGRSVEYGQFEGLLAEACAKVECAGHGAALAALNVDAPAVFIGGVKYIRAGHAPLTFYSLAGPVPEVLRTLYRGPEGTIVDPIRLRAGAIGKGWLPATATAMAFQVQQVPARDAEKVSRQSRRLPYSATAFENVTHAVGALYVPRCQDIEEALIEEQEVPQETRSLLVCLDRVSVPIAEPRKRPRGRPRKGAPKRPIQVVFHMAYVGTLALCDAEGKVLQTMRYGRMPTGDANELSEGMAADAQVLLRKRPDLKVQLVCDGAPEMWRLLGSHFTPVVLGQQPHENLDFFHVLEKLGDAAKVMHPRAASTTTGRWRLRLLNRETAAAEILAELKSSGKEDACVGEEKPVHNAITYFTNHARRLNYVEARRHGLAIASGPVEATCKSLFNVRFKRSGAHWQNETGEHIVQLRAVALSDRWDSALGHTLAPLRKTVRLAS